MVLARVLSVAAHAFWPLYRATRGARRTSSDRHPAATAPMSFRASWRVERQLARLERLAPRSTGGAIVGDYFLRYTHPQSLAAQYRAIFQDQHYRFDVDVDREEPVIIDCGANLGLASLYWKRCHRRARILAFEPDAELAAAMRQNFDAAGVAIDLVEAAVWTETDHRPFARLGAGMGRFGDGLPVATVRLKDYLGERIDLLKVDIEGAEVDVLTDCEPRLDNVDRVFVEFHSFVGRPQRLDDLMGVLTRAGYRCFVRTEFCPFPPFTSSVQRVGMDLQLNIYARRIT